MTSSLIYKIKLEISDYIISFFTISFFLFCSIGYILANIREDTLLELIFIPIIFLILIIFFCYSLKNIDIYNDKILIKYPFKLTNRQKIYKLNDIKNISIKKVTGRFSGYFIVINNISYKIGVDNKDIVTITLILKDNNFPII
jgi:hypothetical protein